MVETFPDTSAHDDESQGNQLQHDQLQHHQLQHDPFVDDAPRLFLSTGGTPVERELIRAWVGDQPVHGGRDIVEIGAGDRPGDEAPLAGWLGQADRDDVLLVPVRVVWQPGERDGRRTAGWRDLLALRDPRRPRSRSQARIARRHSDRYVVVAGEPATVAGLGARYAERGGGTELPGFVVRQALLALERAERAVIGDRYKVPRLVVEEITEGPRFGPETAELARRLGQPLAEVQGTVKDALTELVAVQSRLAIDIFGTAMRPFHARAWNVVADTHDLEALRELNRRHALVFLPSHRSYADPFVLAEALHSYDFPRNHVVGGSNLAFWPLAPLARRAGIVFIRRSFRDDEAYKLAVRQYFGYLVAKRFNLEWYFEGGRSRTGKLRPPKYGLLRYLAEALVADPTTEVHLVPVSITYEHLAEVSSMAAEQRGAVKQPEGLSWLARYARTQSEPSGNAVVRFGAPVSMRSRMPATDASDGADEAELQRALNKLAFDVAVGINEATPVLPRSAVALTMLGVGERALTLDELERLLEPMLRYVEARTIPQNGLPMLRREGELRSVLDELVKNNVVTTYDGGADRVYRINPGQHLVAAFYRNNAIHWFVNRAIVELVMLAVARRHTATGAEIPLDAAPLDAAWQEALELRDLLKYEFFFGEKEAFRAELNAEMDLIDPHWRQRTASQVEVRTLLASSGFVMAHRVLRSFLEAQLVVADRLAAHPVTEAIEEKAFLVECDGMGRQLFMQGRLHSEEALSKELFASALQLAEGRGLLRTGDADPAGLGVRRVAFRSEILDVVRRIELAADIDERIADGRLRDERPWRQEDGTVAGDD